MTFTPSMPTPRLDLLVVTVRELFNQLIDLFTEEPRRLDMGEWVARLDGTHRFLEPKEEPEDELGKIPSCGTVGCIAGWGLVLLRPPTQIHPQVLHSMSEDIMEEALGFAGSYGGRTAGDLFVANWGDMDDEAKIHYSERPPFPAAGTPEQAAVVVRRIQRYMELHPEILDREIPVAAIHARLIAKAERTPRARNAR